MSKIKQLNFEGQTIFCGIDVHKKTWSINVRNDDFELENYSRDPCEDNLLNHLRRRYPGANYQVAYEAGFCGFGILLVSPRGFFHSLISQHTHIVLQYRI